MEIAQRIVGTIGVAPEPVDLALVDRVHHAVLAEDLAVQAGARGSARRRRSARCRDRSPRR